jgi:hypothetical protein
VDGCLASDTAGREEVVGDLLHRAAQALDVGNDVAGGDVAGGAVVEQALEGVGEASLAALAVPFLDTPWRLSGFFRGSRWEGR